MLKILLLIKQEDKYIVRGDMFEGENIYGFWQLCSLPLDAADCAHELLTKECDTSYGLPIDSIEYITEIHNAGSIHRYYLAHISKEVNVIPFEHTYIPIDDFAQLNLIYPDAFCRDFMQGKNKSLAEQKKEILAAADKIFSIRKKTAYTDAFIALMDGCISVDSFQEFYEQKIHEYSFGLPSFGFSEQDATLHIWNVK